MSGTITPHECVTLNEILGTKTANGCYSFNQSQINDGADLFNLPVDNPFQGRDSTHHRNSWLMPRLARRLTRNSPHHISKRVTKVNVDSKECERLTNALKSQVGGDDVHLYLPEACHNLKK